MSNSDSSTRTFALGDLFELVKGETPTMKAIPGEYPLVVTGSVLRSSAEYQFDCEAVCIPLVSSTGHGHASIHRLHYQSGKFALANIMVALQPKPNAPVNMQFLHLYLTARKDELLVPLMAGTSNVSLRVPDLARVQIRLPDVVDQERIAKAVTHGLSKLECTTRLDYELPEDFDRLLIATARHRSVFDAPTQPMSKVAPLVRRPVIVDLERDYPELGVRSFGKGTFHKPPLSGAYVGSKKLFWIHPGDLVFQIVFAWEGAVAIAKTEDATRCGSHRFLTCVCDPNQVLADWLLFYFLTPVGLAQLGEASPGGAGRNRTLGIDKLARMQVPIPTIEHQMKIASIMEAKRRFLGMNTFERDAEALRRSILSKTFRGEL